MAELAAAARKALRNHIAEEHLDTQMLYCVTDLLTREGFLSDPQQVETDIQQRVDEQTAIARMSNQWLSDEKRLASRHASRLSAVLDGLLAKCAEVSDLAAIAKTARGREFLRSVERARQLRSAADEARRAEEAETRIRPAATPAP